MNEEILYKLTHTLNWFHTFFLLLLFFSAYTENIPRGSDFTPAVHVYISTGNILLELNLKINTHTQWNINPNNPNQMFLKNTDNILWRYSGA